MAGLLAIAQLGGCSHHKSTTYRPVYTSPASATAPCTNCGSTSSAVTTEGASGVPSTTVPSLSSPSVNSDVTPSPTSSRGGSGSVRSSTVEPPPTAQPGVDPEYDEYGPALKRNSAKPTSPPASPGAGPALLGPKTGQGAIPSTWNVQDPNARLAGRTGTPPGAGQHTGTAARLEPYVAGSGAKELFYPSKADRPWRYIVLHHSASAAGNYDEIDREHRELLGYEGCGYHFVIGNGNGSGDGQIEVARRWNLQKQGIHCRNARSHDVDEYGIGICLVGDLDQQPPTPRQVAATEALVAYLSRRYWIESDRVTTHADLAATPTACPGKLFPTTILARAASGGRDAG
jgi:hypothetical protein